MLGYHVGIPVIPQFHMQTNNQPSNNQINSKKRTIAAQQQSTRQMPTRQVRRKTAYRDEDDSEWEGSEDEKQYSRSILTVPRSKPTTNNASATQQLLSSHAGYHRYSTRNQQRYEEQLLQPNNTDDIQRQASLPTSQQILLAFANANNTSTSLPQGRLSNHLQH